LTGDGGWPAGSGEFIVTRPAPASTAVIDRGVLAQLAGSVVTLVIVLAALRVAPGASTGVAARLITSA